MWVTAPTLGLKSTKSSTLLRNPLVPLWVGIPGILPLTLPLHATPRAGSQTELYGVQMRYSTILKLGVKMCTLVSATLKPKMLQHSNRIEALWGVVGGSSVRSGGRWKWGQLPPTWSHAPTTALSIPTMRRSIARG